MRAGKLLRLARGNLVRDLPALAVSAGGVALGIGCLVFFLALGAGLRRVVSDVFPVSAREVEVVVPQVALGSLLGEQKIDDATVERLRKLRGVSAAYPKMSLRIPAVTRYNGLFFGREIHMGLEIVGSGLMPELIGTDAHAPFEDAGEGKPIPVVVNRRLLVLYNKVFAPQRGLPRLTDSMLIGFQIPIELGRSYVAGKTLPNSQEGSLQLVGFSDRATLAGVSFPLTSVKRINQHFGADSESYSSVLLRAQNADDIADVAAGVKKLGLEIDETERSRALQIGTAVEIVTLALSLLATLITCLAAVNTIVATWPRWFWPRRPRPGSPAASSASRSRGWSGWFSIASRRPACRISPSSRRPSSTSGSHRSRSASPSPCSRPCWARSSRRARPRVSTRPRR